MLFYILKYKNIYFYIGVYSMTNQLDKIHLLLETMKQYAAVPITKQADLIKQLTFMMGAIYTNTNNKADRISYQLNDEGKKQRVYRSSGEVVATA